MKDIAGCIRGTPVSRKVQWPCDVTSNYRDRVMWFSRIDDADEQFTRSPCAILNRQSV
jgi:hypothetical protein